MDSIKGASSVTRKSTISKNVIGWMKSSKMQEFMTEKM